MKKIVLLSITAILVLTTGCWSSPGSLSASTTPIAQEDSYTIVKRDVSGRDTSLMLLTFPISHPDTHAALKDALNKTKADALINVTVDNAYVCFIVFTIAQTIIHGDAVKITKAGKMIR